MKKFIAVLISAFLILSMSSLVMAGEDIKYTVAFSFDGLSPSSVDTPKKQSIVENTCAEDPNVPLIIGCWYFRG